MIHTTNKTPICACLVCCMKKLFLFLFFITFFSLGLLGIRYQLPRQPFTKGTVLSAQDVIPSVTPQPRSIPVRLIIPKISVDAAVEAVGVDKQGNMDVPRTNYTVAWYKLGYFPGTHGNTVIAGHLDTKSGAPAVFYRLKQLHPGDKIILETSDEKKFTYRVTTVTHYPNNKFPLEKVFGSSLTNKLNLITCEGNYNTLTKNYSHRTVLFSDFERVD